MFRVALLALVIVTAGFSPAVADTRRSLQSACAAWDLHIVALVDEVGLVEPASARLVAAAQNLAQARVACREGNAATAMRLYESIDLRPPARGTLPILDLY